VITQLLVLLAAASAAATVAVTARQVALTPCTGQALAAYRAPATAGTTEVDINSALGLVKPGYSRYVYIGVVAGAFAALVLFGMPLVPAAGGAALAYTLRVADEFLRGKTRKARIAIERELPTFVSRLGGMLLVTSASGVTCRRTEAQTGKGWASACPPFY